MAEWYLNFGAGSVKWGPIFKEKDEVERGGTKVVVDIDEAEKQRRLREFRVKKAEKEGATRATGKHPRDDNEGLVSDVMGAAEAPLVGPSQISWPGAPGRGDVHQHVTSSFWMRCGCARACQHSLPCVEVMVRFG
ncbi:unnamed protein product [Prunus armeniaca]